MCLLPGLPRGTERNSFWSSSFDEWRLLKCPFLKPVVGRFFPQQPAHQSIPLDCKKQDFKLFLLSVLALVSPLNDSVVIPRTLG